MWRFEIRYTHSSKRPKPFAVSKAGMRSYSEAKLVAEFCKNILKRGGEVEWRKNCKSLTVDELSNYMMCPKMGSAKVSSGVVGFSTPVNITEPIVEDQCFSSPQLSLSPHRLFDDLSMNSMPFINSGDIDVVNEVPMLHRSPLRIWRNECSFTALCNGVRTTHTANMKESVLTLDTIGFPTLWRILRDTFRWSWDFGPDRSDNYFPPGRDRRAATLVEGLGRDSIYDFLRAFGLTGQTVSRQYTEFHHGIDRFAEHAPFIDIYEYPVHWAENRANLTTE